MFDIKNQTAIQAMREGGAILAKIVQALITEVTAGMTTMDINLRAEVLMAQNNVMPSFKGYKGFPGVVCTSINDEIVHAIPGKRVLENGDLLKIDCGVIHRGYHTDHAVAVIVGGKGDQKAERFMKTIERAMYKGIDQVRPGAKTGDIGFAVQSEVEGGGYSIVRDFIGHGIGRNLHESPEILNIGKKGQGYALIPGMTICIEPICAMGERFCITKSDDWTAVTRDGSLACQIEHTILITETGYEILTKV